VLDIKGEIIPGNQHGILTGLDPDGRAFIGGAVLRTCRSNGRHRHF
jgi:hypothetical protein